ncbi:thioredoxin family protein [Candidatus Parcubacteria bacterium]|nr:thioredoxin family protein [Candidatus Parcubacteria bacterium]
MKKILFIISFFIFCFSPVFAQTSAQDKINLYFFYGDGCPHCEKEEVFLKKLAQENENIKIYYYETWHNKENQDFLAELGRELDIVIRGVPILIIGDQTVTGYYNDEITGKKIKDIINEYAKTGCDDIVAPIIYGENIPISCAHGCEAGDSECIHDCGCSADLNNEQKTGNTVAVPLLGEINPQNFSLPVLTVIMAAIDGFNPCAMWVLLFLINLLFNMKNKFKMWTLGSAFLISSAAVYYLFLAAWLNVILFMGFVFWIRLLIAGVAVASGAYHLRDYFKNRNQTCKVTGSESRQKVFKNLRKIILEDKFIFALFGIIILAGLVNMVELLCSAGIPAVYVPILTMANLPIWQFYAYLFLYVLVFLLDDLIIFFIAMKTLRLKASSSKYTRYSGLIGGIILVIIGLLLMFKPGWLMFG